MASIITRQLRNLLQIVSFLSILIWFFCFGQFERGPERGKTLTFWIIQFITFSIVFVGFLTIGIVYIIIKWLVHMIILWFQRRRKD